MLKEPNYKYINKSNEINNKIKENELSFKNNIKDDYFWNSSAILFIYNSNKIENINHSINDTSGDYDYDNDNDKAEIIQHYLVLKLIYDNKNELLTVDNIKKWHKILMNNIIENSGEYRKNDVFVGQKIFISNTLIEESILNLVKKYNSILKSSKSNSTIPSPYAISAWLSYSFVNIHPFEDGNGRMSRLLANLVLFSFGFPFPVSFYFSNKSEYFKSLRLADRDYDTGRDTSHLAFIILSNSNEIYKNYLSNQNLLNEFKN